MAEERTQFGSKITRGFFPVGENDFRRYRGEGYEELYFGANYYWAVINIPEKKIYTYTEGDTALIECDSYEQLLKEAEAHVEFARGQTPMGVGEWPRVKAMIEAQIGESSNPQRMSSSNSGSSAFDDRYIDAFEIIRPISLIQKDGKWEWVIGSQGKYTLREGEVYLYSGTESGGGQPTEHYYYKRDGLETTQWGFGTETLLKFAHPSQRVIRTFGAMKLLKGTPEREEKITTIFATPHIAGGGYNFTRNGMVGMADFIDIRKIPSIAREHGMIEIHLAGDWGQYGHGGYGEAISVSTFEELLKRMDFLGK